MEARTVEFVAMALMAFAVQAQVAFEKGAWKVAFDEKELALTPECSAMSAYSLTVKAKMDGSLLRSTFSSETSRDVAVCAELEK